MVVNNRNINKGFIRKFYMALVYHGTSKYKGILVARDGAILSNLEKRIEWFKQMYYNQPSRNFEKEFPGMTIEQIALEIESSVYGKYETESRIKCLTVAMRKESTIHYAMSFEDDDGGLILGVDLDDFYIEKLAQHYGNPNIRFVPGRLSLDSLKEIHLSPVAKSKHEKLIKEEFSRYNPSYFPIE